MKNAQSVLSAVLLAVVLSTPHAARAQGGAAVYVVQFRDLKAQMSKMAAMAEALADHGTPREKLSLQQDLSTLVRLVHRLGEDSAQSNIQGLRQGIASNKTLLVVSVAAEALSLESMALDAFIDTGDNSLKAAARDADAVATNLGKGM